MLNASSRYLQDMKTSYRLLGDQRMFSRYNVLGITNAGKVKQRKELDKMLKWTKFCFNLLFNLPEIFT